MEWLGYKQSDLTEGLPRGWIRPPIPLIWCLRCPLWQSRLGERVERTEKTGGTLRRHARGPSGWARTTMYHTCKLTDLLSLSDSGEGAHPDGIGGGDRGSVPGPLLSLRGVILLMGYVEAPEDLAACRQALMESVDN
jgi:hypothetical protein